MHPHEKHNTLYSSEFMPVLLFIYLLFFKSRGVVKTIEIKDFWWHPIFCVLIYLSDSCLDLVFILKLFYKLAIKILLNILCVLETKQPVSLLDTLQSKQLLKPWTMSACFGTSDSCYCKPFIQFSTTLLQTWLDFYTVEWYISLCPYVMFIYVFGWGRSARCYT